MTSTLGSISQPGSRFTVVPYVNQRGRLENENKDALKETARLGSRGSVLQEMLLDRVIK